MPKPVTIDNLQTPQSSLTHNTSNNGNNKRKQNNTSFEARKCKRDKKEKNCHDFISFKSIVFLVEDNITNMLNKIPILLNIEDDPKIYIMRQWPQEMQPLERIYE